MNNPSIKCTALDISKLDCLKCGDYVCSESLNKGNHIWRVYRYKNLYVYFSEGLLKSPDGTPVLGFELDKVNLDKLFKGEKFECSFIRLIEKI